eukprot:Polyplicarium_translucidae@DN3274_c15_g1_i2.p1
MGDCGIMIAQAQSKEVAHDANADVGMQTTVRLPADLFLREREMCDLEMLVMGAFAPVTGYMTRRDYHSVLHTMRLTSGEVFPIPIVLPVPKSETTAAVDAENRTPSAKPQVIKLRDKVGAVIAEVHVTDIYEPNLKLEVERILGTSFEECHHPYAQHILAAHANTYYVGGRVELVRPVLHFDFARYRLSPAAVREQIKAAGWEVVVGFQTRNPMHRSHFELTRQALREASAEEGKPAQLLLTPAVGPTQPGDVEYHIRVRCYKQLLRYYGEDSVRLVLLPLAMRMAGPREAVWHAIIRRNFGCTHFIVGRDHAGPSVRMRSGEPFYGPYEAHQLLKSVQHELGIKPIFGKNMVYVEEVDSFMEDDQVPSGLHPRNISGTQFRSLLEMRQPVPSWFSFPEVVEELHKFYVPNDARGLCVYFTGLPCAGKSTLAVAVEAAIQETENENRRVTVLDADIIRRHLSRGLGFSREDRQLNVRRIGYVASEVVKHGGICLVANIAPYKEDRLFNRQLISSTGGGYIEVYVSTPLDVCESRDIKELYQKARQGVIKQFTGISDPYEVPEHPDLVVDSSADIEARVQSVLEHLRSKRWIA